MTRIAFINSILINIIYRIIPKANEAAYVRVVREALEALNSGDISKVNILTTNPKSISLIYIVVMLSRISPSLDILPNIDYVKTTRC